MIGFSFRSAKIRKHIVSGGDVVMRENCSAQQKNKKKETQKRGNGRMQGDEKKTRTATPALPVEGGSLQEQCHIVLE